jgi:hypothetical protein
MGCAEICIAASASSRMSTWIAPRPEAAINAINAINP